MTISAKIIADSISPKDHRLTTMELRYPRFIHAEFMTHRVFSRNASSSRAIPVERQIQMILDDTAMPIHWGKNQGGMQAREEQNALVGGEGVSGYDHFDNMYDGISREAAWLRARDHAVNVAQAFVRSNYHKQIVNRLLEPFSHITVVVTATEWDNFFELRCHPDAQPEIQELANQMRDAMARSVVLPKDWGEWHLPYVHENLEPALAVKVSAARCARVSYLTHDGKVPTIEQDLALFDRLAGSRPIHASPLEHQGCPGEDPTLFGNFVGWHQHRKMVE